MMKQLSSKEYLGTPLGDSMIGFASSLVPQCGHSGISTVMPLAIGSILATTGIDIKVAALGSRVKNV